MSLPRGWLPILFYFCNLFLSLHEGWLVKVTFSSPDHVPTQQCTHTAPSNVMQQGRQQICGYASAHSHMCLSQMALASTTLITTPSWKGEKKQNGNSSLFTSIGLCCNYYYGRVLLKVLEVLHLLFFLMKFEKYFSQHYCFINPQLWLKLINCKYLVLSLLQHRSFS